jgi:hypothetical protein
MVTLEFNAEVGRRALSIASNPIRKVEGGSHTTAITARGIDCEHKLLFPVLLHG